MDDLTKNIEGLISGNEDVAVSAIVLQNEIGYPKRLLEGDTHEGELEGFNEIYDFACELFGTEDVEIEEEDKYIWFTDISDT